jgi:hypothetical protein
MFGGAGPAFASSDWTPSAIMADILGGANGRALRALRDAGVTVANAWVHLFPSPSGPRVYLEAEVPVDQTATSLREIDRSMRSMSGEEAFAADLERAREFLLRTNSEWLMTLMQESDALNTVVIQGTPTDALANFATLDREATASDVHRVVTSYLDPGRMKVVLVGDWSKLHAQLLELGWGPIELRNSSGAVVGLQTAPDRR